MSSSMESRNVVAKIRSSGSERVELAPKISPFSFNDEMYRMMDLACKKEDEVSPFCDYFWRLCGAKCSWNSDVWLV